MPCNSGFCLMARAVADGMRRASLSRLAAGPTTSLLFTNVTTNCTLVTVSSVAARVVTGSSEYGKGIRRAGTLSLLEMGR